MRFAAFYAVGADQDGLGRTLHNHLLLLQVGLEDPFGGFMRVAVGILGDRSFSANCAFVGHSS